MSLAEPSNPDLKENSNLLKALSDMISGQMGPNDGTKPNADGQDTKDNGDGSFLNSLGTLDIDSIVEDAVKQAFDQALPNLHDIAGGGGGNTIDGHTNKKSPHNFDPHTQAQLSAEQEFLQQHQAAVAAQQQQQQQLYTTTTGQHPYFINHHHKQQHENLARHYAHQQQQTRLQHQHQQQVRHHLEQQRLAHFASLPAEEQRSLMRDGAAQQLFHILFPFNASEWSVVFEKATLMLQQQKAREKIQRDLQAGHLKHQKEVQEERRRQMESVTRDEL
eukprot:g1305.t1